MKPEVVLDKSFLRAAHPEKTKRLCRDYRVIMPGALFFELLTGDPGTQAECFSRLPIVDNPVEIVEHVGKLLQYETRKKRPCPSLSKVRHVMLYRFNPKLASGTFELTQEQQAGIKEWEREVAAEVALHKEMAAATHKWFPELAAATPSTCEAAVAKSMQRVKDAKFVRLRYGGIRRRSYPRKDLLDYRWAFFRWMQVHLVATLEYVRRYGIGRVDITSKRIENDVIDLQYQVMALLTGRIATCDEEMKEAILRVNPEVEIFS